MAHVPNRRGLDDAEINELDDAMAEYNEAREQARSALLSAQAAYQETVVQAAERRDDRILGIVDAADGRGTQARVVEHLGMNPSYLSLRLRKARERARWRDAMDRFADELTAGYVTPALEAMGRNPDDYAFVATDDESATPRAKAPSG
jgi:hypothetical protein